jgi:hypothetical protein
MKNFCGFILIVLIMSIYIAPIIYFSDNKSILWLACVWPYIVAIVFFATNLGRAIIDYMLDK